MAISAAQDEDNVSFSWAFGALVKEGKEGNDRKLVAITSDTTLRTGDRLKILLSPKSNCFVYVIYHDTQGEVRLLFPYRMQQFDSDYKPSVIYYIPPGDEWFELDERLGSETFYLLASSTRLVELEELMSKYASVDRAQQRELAPQIVGAIRQVKRQHRTFATHAERPAPIAGNLRSINQTVVDQSAEIGSLAIDISATNFYSRTFTIEHQQ